jgi:hypothetical protein
VLLNGAQLLGGLGDAEAARGLLGEVRPIAQQHARHALGMIEQVEQALRGR